MKRSKKILITTGVIFLVVLGTLFFLRFYYVFGDGVKTGELNYVTHKGYFFKTYEGKIIQAGFQTNENDGIRSNEFIFSITDPDVAAKLMMNCEGKVVSLHYKEYLGRLPWRGHSKYVVDKIIMIKDAAPDSQLGIPPVVTPQ